MFQERIKKHLDRETALNSNLKKAYAMIFSTYCSKIIQNRIESHPDYESKICDDPIELLTAIEGLMHDTIKAKYPFASLTLAMEMLLHIKQQENETLIDFIKRFKQVRNVFISHVGRNILSDFVENIHRVQGRVDRRRKRKYEKRSFGTVDYLFVHQGMRPRQIWFATTWLEQPVFDE